MVFVIRAIYRKCYQVYDARQKRNAAIVVKSRTMMHFGMSTNEGGAESRLRAHGAYPLLMRH